MTYMEKMKVYAESYRGHKDNQFWQTMKKDLIEISDDFKAQSLVALKNDKTEDAKRYTLIAEGIDLVIDRPEFVINKTSNIVFETCETCGRVWSKVKRIFSSENDLADSQPKQRTMED